MSILDHRLFRHAPPPASVAIVTVSSLSHQAFYADALSKGLASHGISAAVVPFHAAPEADWYACWGWRVGASLRAQGKPVLVMERGYIGDREEWTSLGWNGLNGRAAHNPPIAGRFDACGFTLKPWNPKGWYVLLVGQVDGDCAAPAPGWYAQAATHLGALGLPIKFRPHPVSIERNEIMKVPGCEVMRGPLADALQSAAVVVTYASNTGVDALVAGKPTLAFDQTSMVYGIAESIWRVPHEPNRAAWADAVASCQWRVNEIRDGSALEHVLAARPAETPPADAGISNLGAMT